MQFISGHVESNTDYKSDNHQLSEEFAIPNIPMKANHHFIETKSRRFNLLLQPSLYEHMKRIAESQKTSVNDTIHQILQRYIDNVENEK